MTKLIPKSDLDHLEATLQDILTLEPDKPGQNLKMAQQVNMPPSSRQGEGTVNVYNVQHATQTQITVKVVDALRIVDRLRQSQTQEPMSMIALAKEWIKLGITMKGWIKLARRGYLTALLESFPTVKAAAQAAGMQRTQLSKYISEWGLNK